MIVISIDLRAVTIDDISDGPNRKENGQPELQEIINDGEEIEKETLVYLSSTANTEIRYWMMSPVRKKIYNLQHTKINKQVEK